MIRALGDMEYGLLIFLRDQRAYVHPNNTLTFLTDDGDRKVVK